MRPVVHTETKPWWYVSALEGVRKQTDENSAALRRMDGTIHTLQKKLKEAVCNMNERCQSLESSCGDLNTKLDSCMTTHGELKAISGQFQSAKQARESESDAINRRVAALEWNHEQDKASTDDFRARLSYEVAQEVGELREALELESATLSASLRSLMLDIDFAAQKASVETPARGSSTTASSPDLIKQGVAWVITDEPCLNPKAPTKVAAVQKELAQALESHLRCLRGVLAQSGTAPEDGRDTTPARQQQQARGQPSAGSSPVSTTIGTIIAATDEDCRKTLHRNSPAAAAAAAAQHRQYVPRRVSVTVSRGNNGPVPPVQLAPAEVAPARGLSQPAQAGRRVGQQRLPPRSMRLPSAAQSLAAPTTTMVSAEVTGTALAPTTPVAASVSVPAGSHKPP
eukprot:CAMPEP_0172814552 /NCGR_PEP_ID=MMETSP1075-20121228/11293_1 /TAXON_ID=2916 /ORGANISM="Ceratium fusus, Strain PA161109" /LENGTH=399 /DNA_ID=CAMNT_0013654351 /DNA_START=105 /DNA_END=1304 /DNA_ORIENTATION=-